MKKLLYSIGLLLVYLTLPAQDLSTESSANRPRHLLTVAAGPARYFVKDAGQSALSYQGMQAKASLGYQHTASRSVLLVEGSGYYGVLQPAAPLRLLGAEAENARLELRVAYLRTLTASRNFRWSLGGMLQQMSTQRFYVGYTNNQRAYEVVSSAGLATSLRQNWKIKQRTLRLDYHLLFPLLSHVIRPSYASSLPDGYLDSREPSLQAFMSGGKFQSPTHFLHVVSQFSLHYFIRNRTALGIRYGWDYYHHRSLNPLDVSAHALEIQTIFAL